MSARKSAAKVIAAQLTEDEELRAEAQERVSAFLASGPEDGTYSVDVLESWIATPSRGGDETYYIRCLLTGRVVDDEVEPFQGAEEVVSQVRIGARTRGFVRMALAADQAGTGYVDLATNADGAQFANRLRPNL